MNFIEVTQSRNNQNYVRIFKMYCIFSEHFSGIFLFLCMIYYDSSHSSTIAYAASLNSSEEIKRIFSLPDVTESVLKGAHRSGNFAEGGLINVNLTHSPRTVVKNPPENSLSNSKSVVEHAEKNISLIHSAGNKTNNSDYATVKTFLPTKLTETGSDLFLGVPEVVHINGTSSIKPRKGVYYNKIVARKGVENENETELENQSCFQLSQNECYDAKEMHNVECKCCKEGYSLEKIVKKQNLVKCENCKPFNKLPGKEKCKNICCSSVLHDIHNSTQDFYNSKHYKTLTTQKKQQNLFNTHNSDVLKTESDLPKTITEVKDPLIDLRKNSKKKPSVTKVPYDVEVMTELLSKAQQKVFVPVVVSIFLLPLIGVLIFFLWRRTKEYWDKMHYKRMDFLIDGIYND